MFRRKYCVYYVARDQEGNRVEGNVIVSRLNVQEIKEDIWVEHSFLNIIIKNIMRVRR